MRRGRARVPSDLPGRIRHDICMRMATETHIYGEWPSPIDGADVARKQVGLAFPTIDAAGVWWQESRPAEGGRLAIVCQGPDGIRRDLLPMPWNARTRVHEYGGKSYLPLPGGFVFANFGDQRLYRCGTDQPASTGQSPSQEPLTPAPGEDAADRFADFVLSPRGDEVWCVREQHRRRGWPGRGAPDHPRDRGRPAGRLGRGRPRRDPGPGQRFGLLRLPHAVAGRHPAGLDLLGPPPDAVGRHRTPGRGARRRRPGQRQEPAAADHGVRHRVRAGSGLA